MADDPVSASPTPETPLRTTGGSHFRWEPPSAAELQALMPGYTIEKLLGRGGMGAVYRGIQMNLDRPVAIKILPPGVEKEDPSFAERFKSEAKLMARLNHPAVVSVYDFGTTAAGQLYFAMEFVDGSDVQQMIAAQKKLPPEHALAITAHVCDALAAAHELGIVHRDIKPANVLINMKGQVKVADFGLAKIEDPGSHGLTKTGYAMGTPDFVAPEALMLGAQVDGRADLYAVGVMLYQMLTGQIPRGAWQPASVLSPGTDMRFDQIILKAMQYDREQRYQSSAELRRDLDVILSVPLVQKGAPESAAIPVQQAPQGKPAQRPAAQPARKDAAPANKSASTPPPVAKSKAPLFIGLGAAAAIGIGAFVMLSGGKKTEGKTTASVAAAQNAPSAGATPAQSAPAPASHTWQKIPPLDYDSLKTSTGAARSPAGDLILPSMLFIPHVTARNIAIRGEIRSLPTEPGAPQKIPSIALRSGLKIGEAVIGTGKRSVSLHEKEVWLQSGVKIASTNSPSTDVKYTTLGRYPYPAGVDITSQWIPFEFAVIEDVSMVELGGKLLLPTGHANEALDAGAIHLGFGQFRNLEHLNLDGVSEAEAFRLLGMDAMGNDLRAKPVAATSAPAPANLTWQKIPQPDATTLKTSGTTLTPERELTVQSSLLLPDVKPRNIVIRGEVKCLPGTKRPSICLRDTMFNAGATAGTSSRSLALNDHVLVQTKVRTSQGGNIKYATLLQSPYPAGVDLSNQWVSFEYAAFEDASVARLAGELLLPVGHSPEVLNDGGITVNSGQFRNLEYLNLDGASEAEAFRLLGVDAKGNDMRDKPVAATAPPAPTPATTPAPAPPATTSTDKFPPGQWVKVFTKFEDLPDYLRKTDSGVKLENGVLDMTNVSGTYHGLRPDTGLLKSCGVRFYLEKSDSVAVRIRDQDNNAYYVFSSNGSLRRWNALSSKETRLQDLAAFTLPESSGPNRKFEIYAVGTRLVARTDNGKILFSVVDDQISEGIIIIHDFKATLRDTEVINLDGLSEAEALKIVGVDAKGNDTRAALMVQEKKQAAQQQMVQSTTTIPELAALHEQFIKLTAEHVTAPFDADVAKLNAGYSGGLERKIAEETAAGHLDAVLSLEAEKKLIADKQPPPADDDKTTASLKALRAIYRAASAKIDTARATNLKALTDPLTIRLKTLEADLTKQKRIPDAVVVKTYREKLTEGGVAAAPAATPPQTPPAGASTPPVAQSAGTPAKKYPPGDDRKAAEWVLDAGGSVTIMEAGKEVQISDRNALPRGKLQVVKVTLAFTQNQQPRLPITDLKPLTGLRSLYNIEINHVATLTDEGLEALASLPDLTIFSLNNGALTDDCFTHLASVRALISLSLQNNRGIKGKSLHLLASLRKLRELVLQQNPLSAEGIAQLAQLPQLEKLSLVQTPFEDSDLSVLDAYKNLTYLSVPERVTAEAIARHKSHSGLKSLGFALRPGQGAAQCAELVKTMPKLTALRLEGNYAIPYTREDLASLAEFTQLKEVTSYLEPLPGEALEGLLKVQSLETLTVNGGEKFTDAALERLLPHKALKNLNLGGNNKVTDAGLLRLAEMKNLKEINAKSNPGVTAAGVAALQKLRPDLKVTR